MDYRIRINTGSEVNEYYAPQGISLLQFLRRKGYELYAPCNGKGTCGKCRVRLDEGYRLSCQQIIDCDMEVYLDRTDFKAKVLTEGKSRGYRLEPAISKRYAALPVPDNEDQRSDMKRLQDELSLKKEPDSMHLMRMLPELLRSDDFHATFLLNDKELMGVEKGDTTDRLYGVAIDIGTTTIAAYLLNMVTGERMATYSLLNPQKSFGADVITRIQHTMEDPNGLSEMHSAIIGGINKAVSELAASAVVENSDIYEIVFAGNTTMIHFLLKLNAENIAMSPFIPVTTKSMLFSAAAIGININENAVAYILPAVSAYIGSDIVSAVHASGMSSSRKISLLLDLGTNGEIVLGCSEWMLACSAAAGPAFEGANIRDGVGGIEGAIDSYKAEDGYTTIGNAKPVGICGTGLVDIVSELYRTGIIDETGRLVKAEAGSTFVVAHSYETGICRDIAVTQKDIRELQNAKAAIAAGIKVLIERAGIGFQDIEKVYLAGGFGTYINPESALSIGLLPPELGGRIEAVGNAAGTGAIEALLSRKSLKKAERIRSKIKYIELSTCRDFNDYFINSMVFPGK